MSKRKTKLPVPSAAARLARIEGRQGRVLAYEKGRREIMSEATVNPVKDIKDKAEQMRMYAIRRNDPDLEAAASAIALRAHYHIGQISKGMEKILGRSTNGTSKRETLKAAGISYAAASRDEQLTDILSEADVEKLCQKAVDTGTPAPSAVAIYKQDQDDKRKAKFEAIKADLPPELHVGDFRELSPQKILTAGSVELVFIDPPYDDDSIPLYEAAALEAKRILKPGGSLVSYCGHRQLPHVLEPMSRHLKYYWIGADVHSGPLARMTQYGVIVGFKPLLWFVKEYRQDRQTFINDTVISKREKQTHAWQQSVLTAEHFISNLTTPNGCVVDFFAGGGTTIIAALNLSRPWVAFEIDEKAVPAIKSRLDERVAA